MATFSAPTIESTIQGMIEKGTESIMRVRETKFIGSESTFPLAPYIHDLVGRKRPSILTLGSENGPKIDFVSIVVAKIVLLGELRGELSINLATDGYIVPQYGAMPHGECIRELVSMIPAHVDRLSDETGATFTLVSTDLFASPLAAIIGADSRKAMSMAREASVRNSAHALSSLTTDDDDMQGEILLSLRNAPSLYETMVEVAQMP